MKEIQTFLGPTEPCGTKGRTRFMSIFSGIEHWIKDNQQKCLANATEVTEYAKHFKLSHRRFCGLGQWYRNKTYGAWAQIARKMTHKFEETSHPIFL